MTTDDAALRGDFHFPGGEAALCADCGRCFSASSRSGSDGAHRCPACGGSQFVMVEAALQAVGLSKERMESRMAAMESALLDLIAYAENPRTAKGWLIERIMEAKKIVKD